jgi:DNA-binding GntR family transcriptional regulator
MSPTGLAVQLADILRDRLRARDFAVGEMVPSEKSLMQEHALARGTVRAALAALASEGLLVALPGRGWAVRKYP